MKKLIFTSKKIVATAAATALFFLQVVPYSYTQPTTTQDQLSQLLAPQIDATAANAPTQPAPQPQQSTVPPSPISAAATISQATPTTTVRSADQILQDLEGVVRNNGATLLTPRTSPKLDFDMNGDGKVDATDQIMVRNAPSSSMDKFMMVFDRLSSAVTKRLGQKTGDPKYDQGLDVDRNGIIDNTDYLAIRNALIETRTVYQVKQMVRNDLKTSYGFDPMVLNEAMKQGIITITVDLKNSQVTVRIDPTKVSLPQTVDLVHFPNLIGLSKVPDMIQYEIAQDRPLPSALPLVPSYHLVRAGFMADDRYYDLNYIDPAASDNRIHQVLIYDGNPHIVCVTASCPTIYLLKKIAYAYPSSATNLINAHISYFDGTQGIVIARDVVLRKKEDGKFHIMKVSDLDRDSGGTVLVESIFNYSVTGSPPVVRLTSITRNSGSQIHDIVPAGVDTVTGSLTYQTMIRLIDNQEVGPITFDRLQNLLNQALQIENEHSNLEVLRTQLMNQVNNLINSAQGRINTTQGQLDDINNQILALRTDVSVLRTAVETLRTELQGKLTQNGVSAATKTLIQAWITRMNVYLNDSSPDGLKQLTDAYVEAFRFNHDVPHLESQLNDWTTYKNALINHRDQITRATTVARLLELQNSFPQPPNVGAVAATAVTMPPDPRIRTTQNKQDGENALAQANNEIRIWNFKNSKPVLNSIPDGEGGRIEIRFSSLEGAVKYRVQIARDANFTDLVDEQYILDPSLTVNIQESGTYYVKVRASMSLTFSQGPLSQWSDPIQFRINHVIIPTTGFPTGIYVLDDSHSSPSGDNDRLGFLYDENIDWSFVEGFVWRVDWRMFDPDGIHYDFHMLDNAVRRLTALGRKLSLELRDQVVPQYVLDDPRGVETYITMDPEGPGTTKIPTETAVPWDPVAQEHYRNFIQALANHQINGVALKDHPVFSGIRPSPVGMNGIRDTANGLFDPLVSYDRNKFIQSVLDGLDIVQDAFPSRMLWLMYFSMNDNKDSQYNLRSLDRDMLTAIHNHFNGNTRPVIGLFEENLKEGTPGLDSQAGRNLLTGHANGSPIMLQACDAWSNTWCVGHSPKDDTPDNGFNWGYNNFHTTYYEMYAADLKNPTFRSVFEHWHEVLNSNEPQPPDTTSPTIVAVEERNIKPARATIYWTTNEPADTQVEYGLNTSYGSRTTLDNYLDMVHNVTITGLAADTLYHYRIRSKDAAGNETISPDRTFRTLPRADTTPPTILTRSETTTAGGATIQWTTNEPADSKIEYGLGISYDHFTTLDPSLVTNHSVAITGLISNTLYHYRIITTDASGNARISSDQTFRTQTLVAPTPIMASSTATPIASPTITTTTSTTTKKKKRP